MSAARFPGPRRTGRPPVPGIAVLLIRAIRLRGRIRLADPWIAVGVGIGDLLLCGILLLVAVGALFVEPTTREQETQAWHLAGRIYGCWFLGGLVLFPVLGTIRATVVHVTTMIVTPVALFLILVLLAA